MEIKRPSRKTEYFSMRTTKKEGEMLEEVKTKFKFPSKVGLIIFCVEAMEYLANRTKDGDKLYIGDVEKNELTLLDIDFFGEH